MENLIRTLLDNSNLINSDGKPLSEKIRKFKLSEIDIFCNHLTEITSHEKYEHEYSIFHHAASHALGVGKYPCSSFNCRFEKLQQLFQFSALYSEKVYIRNFLQYNFTKKKKDIVNDFHNDIFFLCLLLPFIEAGRIELVSFPHYCPHCLSLYGISETNKKQYEDACNGDIQFLVES